MNALTDLLVPSGTAVVTMECQRGVIGDLAGIPELADATRDAGALDAITRLCSGARRAGATVVHSMVSWRADRAGTPRNTPIVARLSKRRDQVLEGSDAAALVAPLDGHPGDLRSMRHHGLTAFTGTDLDALLRSEGVTTVVASGVSLNIGVLGLCLSAADLGYRVVVPTDAVVGIPAHYGEQVLHHTLAAIATLSTVDAVLDAWS